MSQRQIVTDANNTTTVVLAADATFTGVATEISDYAQQGVTLYFEPSNANGSLFVDYSPDGTNWDIQVPFFISSNIHIPIPFITVTRWFRIRYVNDGGTAAIASLGSSAGTATAAAAQTVFRLTTLLYPSATKELGRSLDQSVGGSDPVTLTRTVLMGRDLNNSYVNVGSTPEGVLYTTDFPRAVDRGSVENFTVIPFFSENSDIDNGSEPEDIWAAGGERSEETSAAVVSVSSASTDDDGSPAGTGARTIVVNYLDGNYDMQTETLTLDGTTPVTTSGTALTIQNVAPVAGTTESAAAYCATFGSGGENAGDITLTINGNTHGFIAAGKNTTKLSHYTMPDDRQGTMLQFQVAQTGAASNSFIEVQKKPSGGGWMPLDEFLLDATGSTDSGMTVFGFQLGARDKIRVQVTDVSANNMNFVAAYSLLIEDTS